MHVCLQVPESLAGDAPQDCRSATFSKVALCRACSTSWQVHLASSVCRVCELCLAFCRSIFMDGPQWKCTP